MRFLLTGAGGMLARAVRVEFGRRGHTVIARGRDELDVTDAAAVRSAVADARPDAVIQCAAYTRVDDAEREEARALAVNAAGAETVARACRRVGARFLYPSTDYVFSGRAAEPYPPDATADPINAYGRSKLAGERAVREAGDSIVVRTSWLYGRGGRNFVRAMLERARRGEPLRVVDDQRGSPTWTHHLARCFADLLEHEADPGIYHAADRGETTWYGLARAAIELSGVDAEITPVTSDAFPRPAERPQYSVLDCTATESVVGPMPHWRDALADALREGV